MEASTIVERDFNQLGMLFNLVINDMKVCFVYYLNFLNLKISLNIYLDFGLI